MPELQVAPPPPSPPPAFMRIKPWCAMSGMSPAGVYRALKAGSLKAVKLHGTTLIDVAHGLAWLRALPAYRPDYVN